MEDVLGDTAYEVTAEQREKDRLVLRLNAEALLTAKRVWRHADTEPLADEVAIMDTVVKDRPPVYALPAGPAGPITAVSDLDGVLEHYRDNYTNWRLLHWSTILELRSPWYTFFNGVYGYKKTGSDKTEFAESIVLFPMSVSENILGEQLWPRWPENGQASAPLLAGVEPVVSRRHDNRAVFDGYLAALRANDAAAVAKHFDPKAQVASRDYGANSAPYGSYEAAALYGRLLERFTVESVDHVHLVADDWFIFNELNWTVRDKSGRRYAFATADFIPMVAPGKFGGRVGYGTELIEA